MHTVTFSIAGFGAWAPGVETPEAWHAWGKAPWRIVPGAEPGVKAMPAMLRRRAGVFGKMSLQAAYECLGEQGGVPTVFASRHGEVQRAVELLTQLAGGELLSPTAFGMAVHNATAGLFSIARTDRASHIAVAAGESTLEHAVIEACGLLADGAPAVLVVMGDCPLPEVFEPFADCDEQPYAFAWLLTADGPQRMELGWHAPEGVAAAGRDAMPGGLAVLRYFLNGEVGEALERAADGRAWRWKWHAA